MKVMGINCFIFSASSNGVDKLSTANVDLLPGLSTTMVTVDNLSTMDVDKQNVQEIMNAVFTHF